MRKIFKLITGGAAGLTLALALATGGSPAVAWNTTAERVTAPADVSYGPVASLPAERVTAPADVSYGPVAAVLPEHAGAPAAHAYLSTPSLTRTAVPPTRTAATAPLTKSASR